MGTYAAIGGNSAREYRKYRKYKRLSSSLVFPLGYAVKHLTSRWDLLGARACTETHVARERNAAPSFILSAMKFNKVSANSGSFLRSRLVRETLCTALVNPGEQE
jgi:hypothetical protein